MDNQYVRVKNGGAAAQILEKILPKYFTDLSANKFPGYEIKAYCDTANLDKIEAGESFDPITFTIFALRKTEIVDVLRPIASFEISVNQGLLVEINPEFCWKDINAEEKIVSALGEKLKEICFEIASQFIQQTGIPTVLSEEEKFDWDFEADAEEILEELLAINSAEDILSSK